MFCYTELMRPRNLYLKPTADLYEEYVQNGLRYRKVAKALVNVAESIKGQTVIDLGCGTGILTRMLAERVGVSGHVIGVDSSTDMLASARRTTSATNVAFIHSPAEAVDQVIHQPVDALFSSAAFWQFQREPTLAALAKIIAGDGMLYFNLSAGFFNFKTSGLAEPSDEDRPYKQHDILAKWARLAHERYPNREFPPKASQPRSPAPQNLNQLTHQLDQFGFKLQTATPLRFEIPRDDEYHWLKIPQWTDRSLAPLSHAERTTILDEIFTDIPAATTFLARWIVISAKAKLN